MSMFGFKTPSWAQAQPGVYNTPGIGDGIPGNMPAQEPPFGGGAPAAPMSGPGYDRPPVQFDMPMQPQQPAPQASPGFFDKGGLGGKIGNVALDLLAYGPAAPLAMVSRRRAAADDERDFQQKLAVEQFKRANPEQSSVIKTLEAAGIDPRSPEGRAIIKDNLSRPFVVGGAEQGYNVVGGSYGAPGGPPAEAIAMLQQNPAMASFFDQKYGPGASKQYLGQ